jgi:hypothetical protein
MKSLKEFKILTEESDYAKFDMLVRAGLANKAQLQRIHKILDKMKEERPVFNNADRMILQNLFNKMVDLISTNKQIFQQARRAVREETEELEERIIDTADYKISPTTGRKVRAHRIKVGDSEEEIKKESVIESDSIVEAKENVEDPPFVLVLKRKAIRLYPNKTKVALYYNQKINKYFSVPYGPSIDTVVQTEEFENEIIEEAVMDQLHKIVDEKQARSVKFANGQSRKVDHFTASAITQVHKALNDENKKKFADMVHKSPAHLAKASDFAFKRAK